MTDPGFRNIDTPDGDRLAMMTEATLLSLRPNLWDGQVIDLCAYGSLTLTVLVAPTAPYIFQWSPRGSSEDNDWFDWSLSSKAGGSSASVSARGVYNAQAGGFVRLKPNTGLGGAFYIGAGS